MPKNSADWWLERVLIETEIVEESDGSTSTLTQLSDVHIVDGAFSNVQAHGSTRAEGETVDGGGRLLMPTFRDTHLHLDKTFYGGPFRTPIPGRFWLAEEERLLPDMSDQIPVRSNAILDLIVSRGTTSVVAHCNVDHIIGLQNVTRLVEILRARNDVDWEIVAYPQHGLRGGETAPLLREAIDRGATTIGGIDPARIEGDITKALDITFGLAVDAGVGVDFHLHDGGSLGVFEMEQVIRYTVDAGLQGKASLSNGSALAFGGPSQQRALAEKVAAAGIDVSLTVGVGGSILPVDLLDEVGVEVSLGSDSIMDILTPYGQGDILEQLWMLAQRLGRADQRGIAWTLVFGTGEVGRWQDGQTRAWPQIGDQADFFLTSATCSAEVIARRTSREAVYHRGQLVFPVTA